MDFWPIQLLLELKDKLTPSELILLALLVLAWRDVLAPARQVLKLLKAGLEDGHYDARPIQEEISCLCKAIRQLTKSGKGVEL